MGLTREMLIVECDYTVDDGQVVHMKIGLPDGYSSEPYIPEKSKGQSKNPAKKSANKRHAPAKGRKGRAQGGGVWSDVVGNDEVDQ